ncbi:MAG: hypothetical protein ABGX16_01130 [Pirellulales bacterium]
MRSLASTDRFTHSRRWHSHTGVRWAAHMGRGKPSVTHPQAGKFARQGQAADRDGPHDQGQGSSWRLRSLTTNRQLVPASQTITDYYLTFDLGRSYHDQIE